MIYNSLKQNNFSFGSVIGLVPHDTPQFTIRYIVQNKLDNPLNILFAA